MCIDPIGPGSPAWEASEEAVRHAINGRDAESREAWDRMMRELVGQDVSASEIRQWEDWMYERIRNPEPDDLDYVA